MSLTNYEEFFVLILYVGLDFKILLLSNVPDQINCKKANFNNFVSSKGQHVKQEQLIKIIDYKVKYISALTLRRYLGI